MSDTSSWFHFKVSTDNAERYTFNCFFFVAFCFILRSYYYKVFKVYKSDNSTNLCSLENIYLRISATAVGTTMTPSYINLFIGHLSIH